MFSLSLSPCRYHLLNLVPRGKSRVRPPPPPSWLVLSAAVCRQPALSDPPGKPGPKPCYQPLFIRVGCLSSPCCGGCLLWVRGKPLPVDPSPEWPGSQDPRTAGLRWRRPRLHQRTVFFPSLLSRGRAPQSWCQNCKNLLTRCAKE